VGVVSLPQAANRQKIKVRSTIRLIIHGGGWIIPEREWDTQPLVGFDFAISLLYAFMGIYYHISEKKAREKWLYPWENDLCFMGAGLQMKETCGRGTQFAHLSIIVMRFTRGDNQQIPLNFIHQTVFAGKTPRPKPG
jgi:hypothetical protein